MENSEALTPERMTEFLSAGIDFSGQSRAERYAWVQSTLAEQRYFAMGKKQRGAVRERLAKVAGLSLPQITRLIRSYRQNGEIQVHVGAPAAISGQVHSGGFGVAHRSGSGASATERASDKDSHLGNRRADAVTARRRQSVADSRWHVNPRSWRAAGTRGSRCFRLDSV